ncbi:MAG: TSUP family transporter, partial [Candidatus Delongbacteria bacterium]|nr:TSUP family transporter [Candidatus Delongbacteria bacterium]
MELSPFTYFLLFLSGIAGGFIDSIAGGGGLITIPALLLAGLPAPMALGTNKFQSSFGSITSS